MGCNEGLNTLTGQSTEDRLKEATQIIRLFYQADMEMNRNGESKLYIKLVKESRARGSKFIGVPAAKDIIAIWSSK